MKVFLAVTAITLAVLCTAMADPNPGKHNRSLNIVVSTDLDLEMTGSDLYSLQLQFQLNHAWRGLKVTFSLQSC